MVSRSLLLQFSKSHDVNPCAVLITGYLNKDELLVSWKSQLDGSKPCEAHLYTGLEANPSPQETESSQWEMPRAHLSEDTNII